MHLCMDSTLACPTAATLVIGLSQTKPSLMLSTDRGKGEPKYYEGTIRRDMYSQELLERR